jgi:hypothetical protein
MLILSSCHKIKKCETVGLALSGTWKLAYTRLSAANGSRRSVAKIIIKAKAEGVSGLHKLLIRQEFITTGAECQIRFSRIYWPFFRGFFVNLLSANHTVFLRVLLESLE